MQVESAASLNLASRTAFWLGCLTLAAILTGLILISVLGGSSGRDLGADAQGRAFLAAAPILVLAELIKIAVALCQSLHVRSAATFQSEHRSASLASGYAGAALVAASGIVGLVAVAVHSREIGGSASALGFASAAATSFWVLLFVKGSRLQLTGRQRLAGAAFAIASLISVVIAPAALFAGLLGLLWWFGLARAFKTAPLR